jgi:hypothetical protein
VVGLYSIWESLGLFVIQVMTAPDTVIDDAATEEMSVGAGSGGALRTVNVTGRAAAMNPAAAPETVAPPVGDVREAVGGATGGAFVGAVGETAGSATGTAFVGSSAKKTSLRAEPFMSEVNKT